MSRPVSIRACGRAERERRAFVAHENDVRPFARAVARSPAAWSSRCGAETRERCVRVLRARFRGSDGENDRTRSRDDDDDARGSFS